MSLPTNLQHELADRLHEAELSVKPVAPLAAAHPEMGLEDAYAIQLINAARGVREGRRVVGYKVGLTSREAQRYFKVFHPDYGHLFDDMAVMEEDEIDVSRLIQPRIEGEIAFVLGKDLKGPGLTVVDVLSAIDYAMVAMEIVDSRVADWKITAADTIADNGSSARFVLGAKKCRLDDLDLSSIGMAFSKNGQVVLTGAGAAVMGNPLNAVVFLANELGKVERGILAGEVILSGSVGGMVPCRAGEFYSCEMARLGRTAVRFVTKEGK